MSIGPKGQIGKYRFYPAVMRSRARLTYAAVAAALANPQGEAARPLKGLLPGCSSSTSFSRLAQAARSAARSTSRHRNPVHLRRGHGCCASTRVERNDAHRIIEECMLAANVCSSTPVLARASGPVSRSRGSDRREAQGLRDS